MTIPADQLAALLGGDKHLQAAFTRARICREGTYGDFVEQLYKDLDGAIYGLQRSRELLQKDIEDRITLDLLLPLRHVGYSAEHDTKTGGHVDMSISFGEFTWIGEAKKDGNFREGFLQLMTRYVPASGDYSHNAGGLLFYLVKTADAAGKLKGWMEEIRSEALSCEPCSRNVLAMHSVHTHEGSGTPFKVRTMAVTLYHRPKDKSGLATEARRAKKAAAAPRKTKVAKPRKRT